MLNWHKSLHLPGRRVRTGLFSIPPKQHTILQDASPAISLSVCSARTSTRNPPSAVGVLAFRGILKFLRFSPNWLCGPAKLLGTASVYAVFSGAWLTGRFHRDPSTRKAPPGSQHWAVWCYNTRVWGSWLTEGSLEGSEQSLSTWARGAPVGKIRQAGTRRRPRQSIAGLPSSALAPQKDLSAFVILFLGVYYHLSFSGERWLYIPQEAAI